MTCKDCIGYPFCSRGRNGQTNFYGKDVACNNVDILCNDFKNKADFVGVSDYQAYGYVVFVPDEVSSDELEDAKLFVLEKIVEFMRREAEENPDFFIINRKKCGDPLGENSVGLKVYLPKRKE